MKEKLLLKLGDRPFAANQYGFTKRSSMMDALEKLRELTELASIKQKYKALVTVDVQNAFNNVQWIEILKALKARKVPAYLRRMLVDYFVHRKIRYLSAEGWIEEKMYKGVPQGSILGPILWNITYDELLKIKLPEGAYLIGYADDVAAVVIAKDRSGRPEKKNRRSHETNK